MSKPPRTYKLRILIADQHPLYREGLAHASRSRDCYPVAQASSGPEALQQLRKLQPDVAVISMDLQDLDGLDLLRQAKQDGLPTRIVILADPADSERLFDAILSGASVLTKMADAETLRKAIAAAAHGEEIVAPELANVIGRKARQRHGPDGTMLTRREHEILKLTSRGLSAQKVGQELNLAASTVKTHLAHIYKKFAVNGATAAVAEAMRQGLIT